VAATTGEDPELRFTALRLLDESGWPHEKLSLEPLIRLVAEDREPVAVRNRCTRLFQRLKPVSALHALASAASSDDVDLSREALEAIRNIHPTGGFKLSEERIRGLGARLVQPLGNPNKSGSRSTLNLRHGGLLIGLIADLPGAVSGEAVWRALNVREPGDGDLNPGKLPRSDFGYWLNSLPADSRRRGIESLCSSLQTYSRTISRQEPALSQSVSAYARALEIAARRWPYSVFRFRPDHLVLLVRNAENATTTERMAVLVKGTLEGLSRHGLYRTEAELDALIQHGYTVQFHEAGTRREFLATVLAGRARYGAVDLMILDGHGNWERFFFQGRDPDRTNTDKWEHTIGGDHRQLLIRSGMAETIKPRGHVVYGGCDGGAGGSHNPRNLANALHPLWVVRELSGEWACSRLTEGRRLRFDSSGRFLSVEFLVSPKNLTSSIPEARGDDPVTYNAAGVLPQAGSR
jgi:hypothetical protein